MHSDSDISKPTMISARDRKAEILIEKYGLDSSTTVREMRRAHQHHGGYIDMFQEASRMVYERAKSNKFVPIF